MKIHLEHAPGAKRGYCGVMISSGVLVSRMYFFSGFVPMGDGCKRCAQNYRAAVARSIKKRGLFAYTD